MWGLSIKDAIDLPSINRCQDSKPSLKFSQGRDIVAIIICAFMCQCTHINKSTLSWVFVLGIEPPGNSGSRPAIDSHGFRYLIVAIARIGIALLMFFAFDVWSVNFLGTLCIQFAYKVSLFCSIHIMDTTVWFCYTSYTLHNKFIHFAYKVSLFSSIHMDTTVWFCYTSYTLHNNFIHFAYKVSLFCHTLPHAPQVAMSFLSTIEVHMYECHFRLASMYGITW